MGFLINQFKKLLYQQTLSKIKSIDPALLLQESASSAVTAFVKAEKDPIYKDILQSKKISLNSVQDIDSFIKNVPVMTKIDLFDHNHLNQILAMSHDSSLLLSSGSSRMFSFGMSNFKQTQGRAMLIEAFFDYFFKILSKKTLIINTLPYIELPQLAATICAIPSRIDALLYLLQNVSDQFDQTILIGDPHFIKNALEDGQKEGVKYSDLAIHLVVGGVFLPETMRSYLAGILGIDFENKPKALMISSMGISEFGVNVFFETQTTIELRRLLMTNAELRRKILGDSEEYLPMIFHYLPQKVYIETVDGLLTITDISNSAPLPLIRYQSQDFGKIVNYSEIFNILKEFNCSLPDESFHSPFVFMYGKKEFLTNNDIKFYSNRIEEKLYEDSYLAAKSTGYFRLTYLNSKLIIEIQLKRNINATDELQGKYAALLSSNQIPVKLYSYQEFPHGMELDFQKKFKFVN